MDKTFCSDKDLSRFEFLRRILLFAGVTAVAHFLLFIKFSIRTDHPSPTVGYTFDIMMACIFIIWILNSKIVIEVKLAFAEGKVYITYMTPFRENNIIEVGFERIKSTFIKKPDRYDNNRWTLTIYASSKKIISIKSGDDGFSLETLKNLENELKLIVRAK